MEVFRKDYPKLILNTTLKNKSGITNLSPIIYSEKLCGLIKSKRLLPEEFLDIYTEMESGFMLDGKVMRGVNVIMYNFANEPKEPVVFKKEDRIIFVLPQLEKSFLIDILLAQTFRDGLKINPKEDVPFCINFADVYDITICGKTRNDLVCYKFVEACDDSFENYFREFFAKENFTGNVMTHLLPKFQLNLIFQVLFAMVLYQESYGISAGEFYPENICIIDLTIHNDYEYGGKRLNDVSYFEYKIFGKSYYLPYVSFIVKVKPRTMIADKFRFPMLVSGILSERTAKEILTEPNLDELNQWKNIEMDSFISIIEGELFNCSDAMIKWADIRKKDATATQFFLDEMFDGLTTKPNTDNIVLLGNIP